MKVLITLASNTGADTGPFNLYSDANGYSTAFATSITRAALVTGYSSTAVPADTTIVRVTSTGTCTTSIDLIVDYLVDYFTYLGTANEYATSGAACTNANSGQTYYLPYPVLTEGQKVYNNPSLTSLFNGGNQWISLKQVNTSDPFRAVQVNTVGEITATANCS